MSFTNMRFRDMESLGATPSASTQAAIDTANAQLQSLAKQTIVVIDNLMSAGVSQNEANKMIAAAFGIK